MERRGEIAYNMKLALEHAERMINYHRVEAGELVDHGAKPDQYKKHVLAQRSIIEEFTVNN